MIVDFETTVNWYILVYTEKEKANPSFDIDFKDLVSTRKRP